MDHGDSGAVSICDALPELKDSDGDHDEQATSDKPFHQTPRSIGLSGPTKTVASVIVLVPVGGGTAPRRPPPPRISLPVAFNVTADRQEKIVALDWKLL